MALTKLIRLQKYLAQSGVASRRKAEELIKEGRVRVDGRIVTEMGVKIDPDRQSVQCDNKKIDTAQQPAVYILLNKPRGYVTTLSDPQGRPIVTSLLDNISTRVFPVGRLDLDTEGALLLTNDGDLAHRILHPSHETTKSYEALVKGIPPKSRIKALESGIELEGQKTWPAKLTIIKRKEQAVLFRITIHEGRKRQIRKMFQAVGHPVIGLKRIAYGKLTLGSLKTGSYRFLSPKELEKIFL
jgi:23S rRNA pseudouridine2605 synthase